MKMLQKGLLLESTDITVLTIQVCIKTIKFPYFDYKIIHKHMADFEDVLYSTCNYPIAMPWSM